MQVFSGSDYDDDLKYNRCVDLFSGYDDYLTESLKSPRHMSAWHVITRAQLNYPDRSSIHKIVNMFVVVL